VEARYLAEAADAVAVNIQVTIDEVEGLEDIADAAAPVEIEGALENNVFGAEGVGGGDDADHAIGYGDAEVMGGIDRVGADRPGIGGGLAICDGAKQEGEEERCEGTGATGTCP